MSQQSAPCPSPISSETLASYWSGDQPPDEQEATELHLMACSTCTAASRRLGATIAAVRAQPAAPALRVVDGGRARDVADAAPRPAARRRWLLGAGGLSVLAAAAAALLVLLPRGVMPQVVHRLPAPLRDATRVVLAIPASTGQVRLEPEVPADVRVDGARLKRMDGPWLTVRVEAGPPFAVIAAGADLVPGRYDLELVSTASGVEVSRVVYRFTVSPH